MLWYRSALSAASIGYLFIYLFFWLSIYVYKLPYACGIKDLLSNESRRPLKWLWTLLWTWRFTLRLCFLHTWSSLVQVITYLSTLNLILLVPAGGFRCTWYILCHNRKGSEISKFFYEPLGLKSSMFQANIVLFIGAVSLILSEFSSLWDVKDVGSYLWNTNTFAGPWLFVISILAVRNTQKNQLTVQV